MREMTFDLFDCMMYMFCYIVASCCLCFWLRAVLLVIQMAASRLSLAAIRIFVFTRCCGLSFNCSANKTYQSFSKSNGKNNQIYGQITSFPKGRRCQHAGLTLLTSCYPTVLHTNIQINVRISGQMRTTLACPFF